MTDQQDLSLLTDEEIRQEAEDIVEQIDAAPVENRIRALARALIAARAENKRLLDGLGEFADYMDTADNLSDEGREDEAIEVRERVRQGMRALLQSEKGGE